MLTAKRSGCSLSDVSSRKTACSANGLASCDLQLGPDAGVEVERAVLALPAADGLDAAAAAG